MMTEKILNKHEGRMWLIRNNILFEVHHTDLLVYCARLSTDVEFKIWLGGVDCQLSMLNQCLPFSLQATLISLLMLLADVCSASSHILFLLLFLVFIF